MKVIVVDDSIVFRSAIVSALTNIEGIEVTRSLSNGKLAVDHFQQNQDIGLITLDMEMPVLDGMETIKEIRKFNQKVFIIVFSSLTQKGAEKTIEALNAGANDFVTKPENFGNKIEDSVDSIKNELLPKILAFKDKIERTSGKKINSAVTQSQIKLSNLGIDLKVKVRPNLIVIGCSTGGPEALGTIFRNIKSNINIPMLIVQHMPPLFTQKLAEMLTKLSPIEVREAKHGDKLAPGLCLIAPGDFHMVVDSHGEIHLNKDEKVCYVRPSVDVLFNSVAENFRGNVLSIILTGMGEDGAIGAKNLAQKGSSVFIQDKESSIVWGMPGSVKKQVEEAHVIALNDIGMLIVNNGI